VIVVTGATGNVGRPLIDLLLDQGVSVRAVTRRPDGAQLPPSVETVTADPARPGALAAALDGATALFLNPRAVRTAAADVVRLAARAGVRRVVALSALNVDRSDDRQPSRLRGDLNREVEAAATGSGLEWVGLRPGAYALNAVGTWAGQIRASDVVRGVGSGAAWAPIHERDVAAVAAHALVDDALLGRRPVLTGPRCLTQAEMVTAIGTAIGRPLRFLEIPVEAARAAMVAQGFADEFAAAILTMTAESFDQAGLVSAEVERILGRPATEFAAWAVEHADDFR
jgi:uncharacterized protein YbjT (DUF2867 family)